MQGMLKQSGGRLISREKECEQLAPFLSPSVFICSFLDWIAKFIWIIMPLRHYLKKYIRFHVFIFAHIVLLTGGGGNEVVPRFFMG